MPHSPMDAQELSCLLGLDERQVEKLAQRGQIPCQKVGGKFRFNRAEISDWLKQYMATLTENHLANMDAGITAHRQIDDDHCLVTPLLRTEAISVKLPARTKNSVLRELAALAQETGLVYDGQHLLDELFKREELCSTAMEGGIAIPHPRRPMPYAIEDSILVIARTSQGIGFGAPDGRLTDLFFLTCSKDDRHHLHLLARLCRILQDENIVHALRQAQTDEDIIDIIVEKEANLLADLL